MTDSALAGQPRHRLRSLPTIGNRDRRLLVVLGVALLIWALLSATGRVTSPLAVAAAFIEIGGGALPAALGTTLGLFLLGLVFGSAIGVPLGLAMGFSPLANRILGSVLHPLRQVPLFGWIPLIILIFGLGQSPKIVFVSMAVSYVMVLAAYEAARAVPQPLAEVVRLFQLPRLTRWRLLTIPSLLPQLFSGLRVAVMVGWSAVFGAEILLAHGTGLGALVWGARELGRYDIVIAATLILVVFGILTSRLMGLAERRLFGWRLPRQET